MNFDLVFRNHTRDKTWGEDFFRTIIESAAKVLNVKTDFSVSVNLIGETESQKLNKKHRGKDKPTDVLSFLMRVESQKSKVKSQNEKSLDLSPSTLDSFDLGDIFICLSIAKKEAKEENMNVERKLAWLTVHGFLHLAGYDHELSQKDKKRMQNFEDTILRRLKLKVESAK